MGMTPLWATVNSWRSMPFVWGQTDCMMVLADWVLHVRGVDPARDLRGMYDDRVSCQRASKFFTEPLALLDRCFGEVAGLRRGNELQPGDVALLEYCPNGNGVIEHVGGLWLGDCWACKGRDGVVTLWPGLVRVAAVWSVGYQDEA